MNKDISRVMDATTELITNMPWYGACYATSAIHYILLDKLDIRSTPKLGVVSVGNHRFDHGWIEIDDLIYDTAISFGEKTSFLDVFGVNGVRGNIRVLDTQYNWYKINYRVDEQIDSEIATALNNFGEFMRISPSFNSDIDYWDLTILFGDHLGMKLDRASLIAQYSEVRWDLTVSLR
ncbi:hypothetical protein ACX1NX_11415 [Acinetobacter sp. ANC 5383]